MIHNQDEKKGKKEKEKKHETTKAIKHYQIKKRMKKTESTCYKTK